MNKTHKTKVNSPIIVGGVGGSGTRLVVDILKSFDIFMGDDLNRSNDNMALARDFHIIRDEIQKASERDFLIGKNIPSETINPIIENFLSVSCQERLGRNVVKWGWKVPGNFLILNYLSSILKGYKYIHVIRHGLDMAFSSNQNQVKKWGLFFGIDISKMSMPEASFKYWLKINNYVNQKCLKEMPNNYYLLNFDKMVLNPERELKLLSQFLVVNDANVIDTSKLIRIPASIGRYKLHDIKLFNQDDVKELRNFGFTI